MYFLGYIFLAVLCFLSPRGRAVQKTGQPFLATIWLRIEVDAVGYSNEHVAVGDAVILGHAHADAVASRVDHGLEVAGRVDPVVDGALGSIDCTGEHGEVVAEAVGISGLGSGLTLFWSVMPGVAPVGAGLGGVHQGLVNW